MPLGYGKIHLDQCKKCKRILWIGILDYSLKDLIRNTQWFYSCKYHNGSDYIVKKIPIKSMPKLYRYDDIKDKWLN